MGHDSIKYVALGILNLNKALSRVISTIRWFQANQFTV